jgi:hypothetical protein
MTLVAEPTSSSPSPPPPTTPAPRGWRDMRSMLLAVGTVLLASVVAVVIAYAVRGSSGPTGDIRATTVDFRVVMPTVLKSGKHTIAYTNNGKVPHEIVMFKTALPASRLPLLPNGNVNEDSHLLSSVADSGDALAPGGAKSVPTSSLTPGHYVAVCNLPGHYGLGMHLDITVR